MDEWDKAAQRIIASKQQQANKLAALRQPASTPKREQTSRQDMELAIQQAVPALQAFIDTRGPAAQRLLAACGERASIELGAFHQNGSYTLVCFNGTGLFYEHACPNGGPYSNKETRERRSATAQEAVEFFANHGIGKRSPHITRDIVAWLTGRINYYMAPQ